MKFRYSDLLIAIGDKTISEYQINIHIYQTSTIGLATLDFRYSDSYWTGCNLVDKKGEFFLCDKNLCEKS
jgi:hypothetical protein